MSSDSDVEDEKVEMNKKVPLRFKNTLVIPEWELQDSAKYEVLCNRFCPARHIGLEDRPICRPDPLPEGQEKAEDPLESLGAVGGGAAAGPSTSTGQPKRPAYNYYFEFDHLRFQRYKALQGELFEAKRMESIRKGETARTKITYTDDYILKEMFELHGPMDTSHPEFREFFEAYKEDFMEEIADNEENEDKQIQELIAQGRNIIDPDIDLTSAIYKKIEEEFTPEEIAAYGDMNPATNKLKADFLALPRPKEEEQGQGFGKEALFEEVKVKNTKEDDDADSSSSESEAEIILKEAKLRIAAADPKYLYPEVAVDFAESGLTSTVVNRLNSLVHQYPYGVEIETFWEAFYRTNNYRIDYKSLGYNCLNEIIEKLPDVFFVQRGMLAETEKTILYPSACKGQICSLDRIALRIRHHVLQVIALHDGILNVESINKFLYQDFGVKFDSADWGYDSQLEFAKFIVRNHLHDLKIEEYTVASKDQEPDKVSHYILASNFKGTIAEFMKIKADQEEANKQEVKVSKRARKFVPEDCLGAWEKVKTSSDLVIPGDIEHIGLTAIKNPFCFTGVRLIEWNNLEAMQIGIIQRDEFHSDETKVPEELADLGLLVLVYSLRADSDDVKEWHRGRIYGQKKNLYKIVLLDYGSYVYEKLENIRFYPRIFQQVRYHLKGVMCSLNLPKAFYKFVQKGWPEEAIDIFSEMCNKGNMRVKFLSATSDPQTQGYRWSIFAAIVERGKRKEGATALKVLIPDLAAEFERVLRERGILVESNEFDLPQTDISCESAETVVEAPLAK